MGAPGSKGIFRALPPLEPELQSVMSVRPGATPVQLSQGKPDQAPKSSGSTKPTSQFEEQTSSSYSSRSVRWQHATTEVKLLLTVTAPAGFTTACLGVVFGRQVPHQKKTNSDWVGLGISLRRFASATKSVFRGSFGVKSLPPASLPRAFCFFFGGSSGSPSPVLPRFGARRRTARWRNGSAVTNWKRSVRFTLYLALMATSALPSPRALSNFATSAGEKRVHAAASSSEASNWDFHSQ
mmetsp:Transcript_23521/g.61884  ORF Transcript_23521/g.61884 Transcript_23521/m.61884 type:complete len:239 (-) Transcript_23521:164-880(-)